MTSKIRLLGIAPYENMKFLMQEQAKEYPDIELTVFVGDLQQGVELARRNFYNDYDVIISRGGTATKLRERLDLPVVEVPILPYDIMRAMKLAENVSSHYAIVGFPNVTASAQILCQLMQHRIDIYTVQDADQVESVLKSIQRSGTRAIYVIWWRTRRLHAWAWTLCSSPPVRRAFMPPLPRRGACTATTAFCGRRTGFCAA